MDCWAQKTAKMYQTVFLLLSSILLLGCADAGVALEDDVPARAADAGVEDDVPARAADAGAAMGDDVPAPVADASS